MLFKTEPMQHQKDVLARMWERKSFALFWEMGLGKTKTIIDNINLLYGKGLLNGAIIIGDKGNYLNWIAEFEKHSYHPYNIGHYAAGAGKKQLARTNALCKGKHTDLDILLVNVEAFSSESPMDAVNAFLATHKTMIIVDEATSIKNYGAKRTKRLCKVAQKAAYKRIMTGTPITNSCLDLYGQFTFLDTSILNQPSYVAFRSRYAIVKQQILGNRTFPLVVGFQNQEELAQKIDPHSSRLLKKDCLDLPEKTYMVRNVEHTQEQKKFYQQLIEEALVVVQQGIVSAQWAITLTMKLRQLNSGLMLTDMDREPVPVPCRRLDELMRVVEETSGSIIIWAAFQFEVEAIAAALRKEYGQEQAVCYYGPAGDEERRQALIAFCGGHARFFVGTAATGGKGLTLTVASTMIYYSNTFKLEERLQSEDRIHRKGQVWPCTYVDLVVLKTIDEKIREALLRKQDLSKDVLGLLGQELGKDLTQGFKGGDSVSAAPAVLPY